MLAYPPPPQRLICPSFKPSEEHVVHSMTLGPVQRRTQYGSRDVYNLHGLLGGNGIVGQTFIPANHALPPVNHVTGEMEDVCPSPVEFPRQCLKFVEKLGEGLFGEVSWGL